MTHQRGKQEEKSHLNKSHLKNKRTQQLRQSLASHLILPLSFSEMVFVARGSWISSENSQILSISSLRGNYFLVLYGQITTRAPFGYKQGVTSSFKAHLRQKGSKTANKRAC